MQTLDLLGSFSRVETPFVMVQIGKYTFGVYNKETSLIYENNTSVIYNQHRVQYPNFIKYLQIKKMKSLLKI